jgi:pyruvate kinase
MRRTKIICTIGPATRSKAQLKQLVAAGMDLARLNFSHGTLEEHGKVIETLRALDKGVAIMGDLQGPKIRIGGLKDGQISLVKGQELAIGTDGFPGDAHSISVNYNNFARDLRVGHRVFLDDGAISLVVVGRSTKTVRCRVVTGGVLRPHIGVNLPDNRVSAPSLTNKDRADLRFSHKKGVDFIAFSFVRTSKDIRAVRQLLNNMRASMPIIAKIETAEAVDHLDELIKAADGIMVARGDLGIEVSLEKVPLLQKRIIAECNRLGKPVVTATQMLESMIQHPRPTRAEASDVANAILDGTDALLLSGETAVGKYPLRAITMAKKIAKQAEGVVKKWCAPTGPPRARDGTADAIAMAACKAAENVKAKLIVAYTQSGATAKLVAKYRPAVPILAVTVDQKVSRQLQLFWGVQPVVVRRMGDTEQMIRQAEREALRSKKVRIGDCIVITAGLPIAQKGNTNMLKVHQVGSGR